MGDRNSSLPSTSHVLSQQMRHTGRCVSSSPLELECIFPLDQTGGSACGCVLIAPFGSSFCAVSRVGVTPWVNRGGLYPSCVHASTVPETSGVSSPPFDTENQRPGEAENLVLKLLLWSKNYFGRLETTVYLGSFPFFPV